MRILIALLLLTSPALAQQIAPNVEALQLRLMSEINVGLSCSVELITARREVERLTAELKSKDTPNDAQQKPGPSSTNGGGSAQSSVR